MMVMVEVEVEEVGDVGVDGSERLGDGMRVRLSRRKERMMSRTSGGRVRSVGGEVVIGKLDRRLCQCRLLLLNQDIEEVDGSSREVFTVGIR